MNKRTSSMSLEDLAMYIKDLHRMGFVSECYQDGKPHYRLTNLGIQSGLQELPQMKIKKR